MGFNEISLYNPIFYQNWESETLYNLAIWKNGLAFKKINFNKKGKPVIKIAELKNGITSQTKFTNQIFDDGYFLKKGDMLFSWSGNPKTSIDVFWYRLQDGWVNQHIFKVKEKNGVNRKYFYFLLKYLKPNFVEIAKNKQTTGLGHVTSKDLKRVIVRIPKIDEQKKIATILSSIDDKIELNSQINKNLEQIAQTIFKHWFIDFEFPNENGEPYKSSGGEMIESELGLIPKKWNVRSLNQIADFLNGLAMQKYRPKNDESHLPVLKIKELKIGKTSKNSDKCSINIEPKYIVDNGDVVFSWSGSLEVKLWCGNKAGLNQHLFKVTSANYPKWFYYYWTKHHIEDFRRIAEDKTTTMGHIKREHLRKAKVLDPGEIFFEKFGKVVNGLIELYINNEKEIKYLSQLRDILLPKLISGEIRVSNNNIKEGE